MFIDTLCCNATLKEMTRIPLSFVLTLSFGDISALASDLVIPNKEPQRCHGHVDCILNPMVNQAEHVVSSLTLLLIIRSSCHRLPGMLRGLTEKLKQ